MTGATSDLSALRSADEIISYCRAVLPAWRNALSQYRKLKLVHQARQTAATIDELEAALWEAESAYDGAGRAA